MTDTKETLEVQDEAMEKVVCPVCGSEKIAEIVYGMPAFSEDLEAKIDAGEVILEGCCLPEGEPIYPYECRECNRRFGADEADEVFEDVDDGAKFVIIALHPRQMSRIHSLAVLSMDKGRGLIDSYPRVIEDGNTSVVNSEPLWVAIDTYGHRQILAPSGSIIRTKKGSYELRLEKSELISVYGRRSSGAVKFPMSDVVESIEAYHRHLNEQIRSDLIIALPTLAMENAFDRESGSYMCVTLPFSAGRADCEDEPTMSFRLRRMRLVDDLLQDRSQLLYVREDEGYEVSYSDGNTVMVDAEGLMARLHDVMR